MRYVKLFYYDLVTHTIWYRELLQSIISLLLIVSSDFIYLVKLLECLFEFCKFKIWQLCDAHCCCWPGHGGCHINRLTGRSGLCEFVSFMIFAQRWLCNIVYCDQEIGNEEGNKKQQRTVTSSGHQSEDDWQSVLAKRYTW